MATARSDAAHLARARKSDTERAVSIKEQTAAKLAAEREAIEKIRRENQVLQQELSLESRQSKMTTNEFAKKHLTSLRADGDAYVRKIEVEKRKIADLEQQVSAMQARIFEQRHKMGGLTASQDNSRMIAKQIRILENRLDKALVRYNETLGANKALRAEIDEMRRERVVFDGIYKKLERELHDKSKELAELTEESETVMKLRDDLQANLTGLKVRAEKETEDFDREWKQLSKAIEEDRKAAEIQRADATGGDSGHKRGDLTMDQEKDLKRKIAQGAWLIGKDKATIQISVDKVATYEDAFAKIQEATGIADIDDLVNKFIEAEDKNYSMFNYVNQLASDIEKMESSVQEIKGEIEKYKGQGVNSDNQRKRILKELELRLEKTNSKAEAYEAKYRGSMNHINQLKTSIMGIFNKIGCNTPAVAELLGSQGVTEANMMQYLGIIEQRINEMLQAYTTMVRGEKDPALARATMRPAADMFAEPGRTASPAGIASPSVKSSLKVKPPDWDDISSEEGSDEDDARPLTLEELHRTPLRFRTKHKHKHGSAGGHTGAIGRSRPRR